MEKFWPLVIMVGISLVVSILSKKKRSPTASGESESAAQSPWEDLLQEFQKHSFDRNLSAPISEHEGTQEDYAQPENSAVENSYFTYEDLPQQEALSSESSPYEHPETPLTTMIQVPAFELASSREVDTTLESDMTLEKINAGGVAGIFGQRFDAKMAMLYSEVMRPKYIE